ncbi:B12-binding domain-containing radical SAM protein [Chloroflexota bacterium]
MKITLIQPRVGHNPSYIHEPLNLGYLAAHLIENGYRDIDIHIAAFEADEEIVSRASSSEVVAFTATSPMLKHAGELARQVKQVNPEAIIIFGGAHPTVLPGNTLKEKSIDIVVRGEGEETILEVVQAVERKGPLGRIKGISYRNDDEEVIHNPERGLIPNIDSIPFPARNLMSQEKFLEIGYKRYGDRGAWVFSSRGCPYRCTYCASWRTWTRRWRARSPHNIIGEIKGLIDSFNVDRINFADDTFTISRNRVVEFCRLLEREGLHITWGCNVRVDTVDKELFEIMKSAGCVDVWIGAESGSPVILKDIKKGMTLHQIRGAFQWAKEVGLRRRAYLMLGAQRESKDTVLQTERLAEEIKPDVLDFSILTPYPGCEDYDRAMEKGYVNDNTDWSKIDLFSDSAALMDTDYLTRYELASEHRRLSEKFQQYRKI